jgi:hypothetical protein
MKSDSPEVHTMLSALLPKVKECKKALSSQEFRNALNGMQKMNSDSDEVKSIVAALTSMKSSSRVRA